jgi:hypothetical protein
MTTTKIEVGKLLEFRVRWKKTTRKESTLKMTARKRYAHRIRIGFAVMQSDGERCRYDLTYSRVFLTGGLRIADHLPMSHDVSTGYSYPLWTSCSAATQLFVLRRYRLSRCCLWWIKFSTYFMPFCVNWSFSFFPTRLRSCLWEIDMHWVRLFCLSVCGKSCILGLIFVWSRTFRRSH